MASLADVTVTMGMDASGVTTAAKKAEQDIVNSTNKMKSAGDSVDAVFTKLKGTLATLGVAGFAANAAGLANTLRGLSAQTGLSIAQVQGWRQAIVAAGGDADNAGDALVDLGQKIKEATDGGGELLDTFNKVGVSFEDLQTKSEADITSKVVDGLANIDDAATRSRYAMVLMGEDVKRVDWNKVSSSMNGYTASARGTESGIIAASEAQRKFNVALEQFQVQILTASAPLIEMGTQIIDLASKFLPAIVNIGKLYFAFKILNSTYTAFHAGAKTIEVALGAMNVAAKTGTSIWKAFTDEMSKGKGFDGIKSLFAPLTTGLKSLGDTIKILKLEFSVFANEAKAAFAIFAGGELIAGLTATGGALATLGVMAGTAVVGLVSLAAVVAEVLLALYALASVIDLVFGTHIVDTVADWCTGLGRAAGLTDELTESEKKQKEEVERTSKALLDQQKAIAEVFYQYQRNAAARLKDINTETALIGLGEDQLKVRRSLIDLEKERISAVDDLNKKLTEAKESNDPQRIKEVEGAIDSLNAAYYEQATAVSEATKAQVALDQTERLRQFGISSLYASEAKLRDMQAQTAAVFMPEIAKRYQEITKAANDAAEAEMEREAASRGVKKADLPTELVSRIREAANVNIDAQKKAADAIFEQEKKYRQVTFAADSLFESQKRINTLYRDASDVALPQLTKRYKEIEYAAKDAADAQIKSEAAARNMSVDQLKAIDPAYVKSIQDAANAMVEAEKAAADAAYKAYNANQLRLFQNKELVDVEKKIRDARAEIDLSTMSEYDKIQYNIARNAEETAKAEIASEEARRGSKLSADEVKAYYEAAKQGTGELAKAQQDAYNNSKSFSTGWKQAMNEYVTNANDGASQAKSLFSKTFKGIEDVIVNFAKTGKFEWKNFVASLVEELMRAQIAKLLANMLGTGTGTSSGGLMGGLFGGSSSGGGLLSGIGSLFGSSSNSSSNNNQSSSGGGLFSGLGSILTGGLGGIGKLVGGIGSVLTGGLGGLVSGIGSLFGGLFADGGNLSAGKWGIVGEAGPEIISGPATITPMDKLAGSSAVNSTVVTYNINAVDARSFKTLLAEDPSFIYALSLQGAKSIPNRR